MEKSFKVGFCRFKVFEVRAAEEAAWAVTSADWDVKFNNRLLCITAWGSVRQALRSILIVISIGILTSRLHLKKYSHMQIRTINTMVQYFL